MWRLRAHDGNSGGNAWRDQYSSMSAILFLLLIGLVHMTKFSRSAAPVDAGVRTDRLVGQVTNF